MQYSLYPLALPQIPSDFVVYNLQINSQVLAKNKIGDSPRKHHYVFFSRKIAPQMVVFHLAGYFGNGSYGFHQKTLEKTLPEQIIEMTRRRQIPSALHVFVDGMTAWGGSQFINSELFGAHSDHLQEEVVPLVQEVFTVPAKHKWVLMGASSGGYGALHHVSVPKSRFHAAVAISPDSDFTTSLLPELYKASPQLREFKTVGDVQKAVQSGEFTKRKNFFDTINTLAMTGCYSTLKNSTLQFPLNLQTGELVPSLWKKWLEKDPVVFLQKRARNLKGKKIYLDVGIYDDFYLYFGARKIRQTLQKQKVRTVYNEFPGTHSGLHERKLKALTWLKNI